MDYFSKLSPIAKVFTIKFSEENFREEVKNLRINFIITLVLISISIGVTAFFYHEHITLLIVFSIVLLLLIIALFCLLCKIEKMSKLTSFDPAWKEMFDKYIRLKEITLQSEYKDIKTILKDSLLSCRSTQNLAEKLKVEPKRIIPLREIKNDINNSICGRYRCVLLSSEYDKLKENMIHYFLSFYETIHSSRNNQISRIFPLPLTNNEKIEISLTVEQRKILMSYLFVNMLTGIDTYVLEYSSNRPKSDLGFFPNLDYVIAENGKEKKTELYFSYKNSSDASQPYTFKSNDAYLINTITNDFINRLEYAESESKCCNKLSMGNYNYNRILKFLNLQNEEVSILTDLKNCVLNDLYSNYYNNYDAVKENTVKKIDRWIKRSSNKKA